MSMTRTSIGVLLSVALLTAAGAVVPATRAQEPPAKPQAGHKMTVRSVIALLQQEIDVKDVPQKTRVREILDFTFHQLKTFNMGKEVGILFDVNAFKADDDSVTTEGLLSEDFEITIFSKKVATGTLLRLALAKLPTHNATYLVRPGWIEITTIKAASTQSLLQRRISASFDKRPLDEALQELSDLTGASIVIDGRLGDKSKVPVTATFLNDTTLAGALRLLTDMADLRMVLVDGALYITSPENAQKLQPARPSARPRPRRGFVKAQ
jgi:hypothetical protein